MKVSKKCKLGESWSVWMTSFKGPNKTLTILRENCLKLLHTNESRVTYWRLPTYFKWKAFLLQNLKAMEVSKLSITKFQRSLKYFFFNNIWKVVKPLLQERTRRKIQVLQGCGKEELLKVNINIIFKDLFLALTISPMPYV